MSYARLELKAYCLRIPGAGWLPIAWMTFMSIPHASATSRCIVLKVMASDRFADSTHGPPTRINNVSRGFPGNRESRYTTS